MTHERQSESLDTMVHVDSPVLRPIQWAREIVGNRLVTVLALEKPIVLSDEVLAPMSVLETQGRCSAALTY